MKHFELEDLIQYESLNVLCGDKLGEGIHRTVFRNAFDYGMVVKIANNEAGIRANIEEMQTWNDVHGEVQHWFAQCRHLSSYGSILIQEFVPSIPKGKYKIPAFFTDLKQDNFGLVVGTEKSQVVCRDYGFHLLREKGMTKKLIDWEII